jgi:hypothetical protein
LSYATLDGSILLAVMSRFRPPLVLARALAHFWRQSDRGESAIGCGLATKKRPRGEGEA